MMKSFARIGLVVAALGLGFPALAAPAPRAFEPPPTLPGQGEVVQLEAAVAPAVGGCRPQGSISRSGSIVSVVLNFVRGHFFINNPDPTDPHPDGLDPVELRSYGGC